MPKPLTQFATEAVALWIDLAGNRAPVFSGAALETLSRFADPSFADFVELARESAKHDPQDDGYNAMHLLAKFEMERRGFDIFEAGLENVIPFKPR